MREFVIIIWAVLILLSGILLTWSLKRNKRQIGKYVMYHKLGVMLLSFGLSWLMFFLFEKSNHLIWSIRLAVIALGGLHLWVMYKQKWTKQDHYNYDEDGFFPEFIFTLLSGLIASIAITSAPQAFELIPYSVDVSSLLWDLPLLFVLPYLGFKLLDMSTQVPYHSVENPWVYPLEPTNVENWPWRDLIQVNFQVRRSLREEYTLFHWSAYPWIEAPKEVAVGKIFSLVMQERRKRTELTSIQDTGNEYDGDPQFCWLFSIKRIWYRPATWFRKPRFVNPDLSVKANKIQEGDVIIARRVPGDGSKPIRTGYHEDIDYDNDKTVIIQR